MVEAFFVYWLGADLAFMLAFTLIVILAIIVVIFIVKRVNIYG